MRLVLMYRRRWGLLYLPVLASAIAVVAWITTYWMPLPPRQITIAAGTPSGGYVQMAERYRQELGEIGVAVDILTSATGAGATSALQRLGNPADPSDAGFSHGLLGERGVEQPVRALAIVGKQPLWLFTRHAHVGSVTQMRNLKIAAGPRGSPARTLAQMLVSKAGLAEGDVTWSDLQGGAAATALQDSQVDVVVLIGSGDSPSVRQLTRAQGIYLVGLERAGALTAREPRLHAFVLPQGAIELRSDVPSRDLSMVYASTHLLVRQTMHPALQRALLDAAVQIHSVPSFLQRQAEYPAFAETDFPLSPVALRYADGERPWLESVLPYWWAQLAQILLFVVLPVLLATTLALMWIPRLFSLRVSAALAHYYGEVMFLEADLEQTVADQPVRLKAMLARLDEIERQVVALDLPDRYADRWYTLREHLAKARERVLQMRAR